MSIINNIKTSFKHIPYTLKHYFMVMKLQKQYLGYYKYWFHDMDKLVMYIFIPWIGTHKIQKIHKKYAKHHLIKGKKNMRFDEAILDWESARFTKPDKPMTAYQTYLHKFTDFKDDLIPFFEKFNLVK